MQCNYNSMIQSVKKYGGFYVGRYETGLVESQVVSQKNVKPITAKETSGNLWYGMYNKQKEFNNDYVVSSMIWGSQYDAILNWALQGDDSNKVTEKSIPHGLNVTGNFETDKINNIFDLQNNYYEWTLEADYFNGRTYRGGGNTTDYSASNRRYNNPTLNYGDSSSRMTLYIK